MRGIVEMCLVWTIVAGSTAAASSRPFSPRSSAGPADSIYNANHPRLLFTWSELPALERKVRDGGRDDTAYGAVRDIVKSVYPTKTEEQLFEDTFGINIMPNLGIAAYLETPTDQAAVEFGRHMTLYIADTYNPDDNVFYSPLRMRALAFGYDMFFADAPETLRTYVRNEILAYIDTTISVFHYQRWLYSPYVSNISVVVASALGLAALCLENEMPADRVRAAITRADDYVTAWHEALLDPGGSYHEGAMYAGWSIRNLAYYFWARKRLYDNFDYSSLDKIRNLEKWIAFSTLPIGGAAVNNVNDTAYLNYPLSRHHTYFDWAQTAWGSGLSAWLWERFVGPEYGHESGILADKTATVLWHRNLSPENPHGVVSRHCLWHQQGLYYYRTGWPEGDASDDVVFSFHSGKFRGGHAQEDQNDFTLYGYGTGFAMDNGFGSPAKDSEGHNLVFIDGKGQHNAYPSLGTDGAIREYVLSGFADYLLGDATAAYTTYSEFNRPGYPFPDDDWSNGYDGGNPVEFAHRRVVAVHDASSPPYFIIADDIRKDAARHLYSWRLHTHEQNTIDASANPIRIEGGRGVMDLLVLSPPFDSIEVAQAPFDNGNEDPNTTIISLSVERVNPHFCCVLLPDGYPVRHTVGDRRDYPWGATALLKWPDDVSDAVMFNRSGGEVSFSIDDAQGNDVRVTTDARLAVLRTAHGVISGLLANDVSCFDYGTIPYARMGDGKVNLAVSADTVRIDRPSTAFSFYQPGGGEVRCGESSIPVFNDGGFLVPDRSGASVAIGALRLRAFPNPFNSTATIAVDIDQATHVLARVFDVEGSLLADLWDGPLPKGSNLLRWEGVDRAGEPVATGVYFVRAEIPGASYTTKVVLLK